MTNRNHGTSMKGQEKYIGIYWRCHIDRNMCSYRCKVVYLTDLPKATNDLNRNRTQVFGSIKLGLQKFVVGQVFRAEVKFNLSFELLQQHFARIRWMLWLKKVRVGLGLLRRNSLKVGRMRMRCGHDMFSFSVFSRWKETMSKNKVFG